MLNLCNVIFFSLLSVLFINLCDLAFVHTCTSSIKTTIENKTVCLFCVVLLFPFAFAVIAYCTKYHQYFGSTNEEESLPSGFDDLYYIQVFVCLFSFLLLLSFITSLTISFYFIRRYSRTKNPRNSFFFCYLNFSLV